MSCLLVLQKAKKAERAKRQKEDAKAEQLGLEPPPRKQQKVRVLTVWIGGVDRWSMFMGMDVHCLWELKTRDYRSL